MEIYLPEDPASSTGVGWFSNANNFLFRCPIIKYKTRYNRGLNEDFKTVLVSTMSRSNTKLFAFENWSTPGNTKRGLPVKK
jgi:hypothetical protein